MPAGAGGASHKESADEAVIAVAAVSVVDAAPPVVPAIPVGEGQPSSLPVAAPAVARQARHASRGPDAFEASVLATGSVGRWLQMLGGSSDPTIALVEIGASPAAIATAALGRGRDDGSAAEHTSSSAPAQTPGPADPSPGGSSGGAAAGGCSGAASSASFVLVNALLQEAPNVMLRLHVSQPSWHASFCALILERPD